ncbi:MAG: MATE family multidrug resistance protein [Parasphingorhabdus sp.]|jgi:MATE family multidrug resistance protein
MTTAKQIQPGSEELKKLLKIAIPLSMYYLTEVAMGITDVVIVGRLGSTELGAVGLTAGLVVEAMLICFGLLSVVGVISSQALGAKKPKEVANTVGQGFWLAMTLAVVVLILSIWVTDLLVATGQDPQVVKFAGDYLAWFIWTAPFSLAFVVLRNFLTVLSLASVVVYITVPSLFLNLLLNYALVFGAWGFPEMGVAGAGLASVIVTIVMLTGVVFYVALKSQCREYRLLQAISRLDFSIWRSIFKLGIPVGVTTLLEGGLFVVVGILMGTMGAQWLAANEILFHMMPLAFVMALAIGESAAVRIAFHIGAGNLGMVGWIARTALIFGSMVMLSSSFILWFFPELIAALFIDSSNPDNAKVIEIVVALSSIAAIFQLFDGLQVVTLWCLRGLKDTLVPMWIASAGYWICGLGSGYWFGFVQGYGASGVWWGLAIGLMMTGILLFIRLQIMLRTRVGQQA